MQLWCNDEETGRYPASRTLERLVSAPPRRDATACRVTAEWQQAHYGHPSTYGLLGASFVPDESGTLQARVALPEAKPWDTASFWATQRRPGIGSDYYAKGVFAAIMVPIEVERLGCGNLTFDRAIEDRAASSPMMFGQLALAVVRHIERGCPSLTEEELQQQIKEAVVDATERVTSAFRPRRAADHEPSA